MAARTLGLIGRKPKKMLEKPYLQMEKNTVVLYVPRYINELSMKDMEDLMDEMKGKVEKFKENREKKDAFDRNLQTR